MGFSGYGYEILRRDDIRPLARDLSCDTSAELLRGWNLQIANEGLI